MPLFRNLFIMRQFLLALTLMSRLLSSAGAADNQIFKTNSFTVGKQGTLEILTPTDWTFVQTNLYLLGNPPSVELHSPGNATEIRISAYWDGFSGKISNPTAADFENIVSNVCVLKYVPASVEKNVVLEKLQGPAVSGTFARFTDATWVPMLNNDHRVVVTGMFRSGNIWGNFDMVTGDKNGPMFKQGLQVLESIRRKP